MFRYVWMWGVVCCLACPVVAADADSERIAALEARVAELEAQLEALSERLGPLIAEAKQRQVVDRWRERARQRMRDDAEVYKEDELREIEQLYQVSNRQRNSDEAREALTQLMDQYPESNRAGCGALYLAQWSSGDERISRLREVIERYPNSFYGDGVQVGTYARYLLGWTLHRAGDKEGAREQFEIIADESPNAIGHRGQRLLDALPG